MQQLQKPSIAVLPFQNMSGDPEQEYFTDGITEDIITALSRFRWFFVIARNSTFVYKGKPIDVKRLLSSEPTFTVGSFVAVNFTNPERLSMVTEALRQAGLPE